MPKLRALRKPEDIAAVPADEPVTIDLSAEGAPPAEAPAEPDKDKPQRGADGKFVAAEPEPDPEPDEPEVNPLQKQLDDLKKAEEAARTREAAANTRAETEARARREAETRNRDLDQRAEQAEYDAVVNAFGAAQAEVDKAEGDLETALAGNDPKAAAAAQRKLATATTRLVQWEDAKANMDTHRERARTRPAERPAAATATDPVDAQIDAIPNISSRQRDWVKAHKDAFTDPRKNARLGAAHFDALDAGHAEGGDPYFQFLEEKLGYRQASPPPAHGPDDEIDPEPEPRPTRRSAPMSAPVSRESVSLSNGRPQSRTVTLTPEQREHARISGVSDTEYAKGVIELQRRKALGMYPDR